MNSLLAAGAAGVQVRLHSPQGDWTETAGVSQLGGIEPVPADGLFRIGSVTKTFVSTVVLQLVAEGKVGLDDPVSRYLPQFGLDEQITVRMILDHTSGVRSYGGQPGPNEESSASMLGTDTMQTYHPDDLVRFAVGLPLWFTPGTQWNYSNTNYILAGLLIEQLTGTPYAQQVDERIARPLGLTNTRLPGTTADIPGPHAHGYRSAKLVGFPVPVDVTVLNPSWAWAAGEILSTTADLDRYIAALMDGRLLPPALLTQMSTFHAMPSRFGLDRGYGLGLTHIATTSGCSGTGGSGDIPGYHTDVYSSADGSRRVQVSVSQGTVDADDAAKYTQYMTAAYHVTTLALCGSAR
ncbi:serine hydrolase [Nocardia sp. BMG51109]|uniref:serine hydrolase domain-containing protein n=1 Tax=Nocardia sp. BMG51109 TaxID=1056816 RepID=UPI00046650A6|nr:serine hydrolase domain-containing protein [Nocardia sp. BMG51109]